MRKKQMTRPQPEILSHNIIASTLESFFFTSFHVFVIEVNIIYTTHLIVSQATTSKYDIMDIILCYACSPNHF